MNVVITGTSAGLGLELACVFLESGHSVVGLARSAAAMEHPNYRHFAANVADRAAVRAAAQAAGWDRVDVLINNAGLSGSGRRIAEVDPAEVQQLLDVNLFGALNTVQAFLDPLKAARGRVVNISSRFGSLSFNQEEANRPLAISYSYRISKAAQNMLAVAFANELAEDGVTVDVLHPGSFQAGCGRPEAELQPDEVARRIHDWLLTGERRPLPNLFEIGGREFSW